MFIELTNKHNEHKILINFDHVKFVRCDGDGSIVSFREVGIHDFPEQFHAKEPYEYIKNLLYKFGK